MPFLDIAQAGKMAFMHFVGLLAYFVKTYIVSLPKRFAAKLQSTTLHSYMIHLSILVYLLKYIYKTKQK